MNFVVFSLGRTGTQWLTRALNFHPDIQAFHGPYPFTRVDPGAWDDYFRPIQNFDWRRLNLDHALSGGTDKTPKHIGNIHGLEPTRWLAEPSSFSGIYRCIQLTRHPLTRIDSMRRRWIDYDYIEAPEQHIAFSNHAIASLAAAGFPYVVEDGDIEDKMFVAACSHLFPHDSKFLTSAIPVFRMEDFAKPATIECMTIAACNARWKSQDLDKALALPPVNATTHKTEFTEPQMRLIRALMAHFQLQPIYESLGYEI